MTRGSFLTLIVLTIAFLPNASGGAAQNSSLIYRHSLFSFSYERGQVRLIPAEGAASFVKETRLEVYSFNGGKVFDSGAVGNQAIVWGLQDQSGSAAPDGKYICSIRFQLDGGKYDVVFGQLTKSAQRVNFIDALRLRAGSPANGAQEFFKRLTASRPDDASAWLWYGQTMCKSPEIIFDPQIAPPPLPPPPPPPPPPSKPAGGEQRQEGVPSGRSAGPGESDLKEAINAFQRALDLATDCKTKDQALAYLAIAYGQLGAEAEETESLLKRAGSECATKEVKATTYYLLGVKYWKCAYSLSTAYIDRNKFVYEPFHYRNFTNPADRQNFDDCLTKGFEYLEKALALAPEYVQAIFYKGLLCREKQKGSQDETERAQWAKEAQELASKGIALQRKKEGRQ